MIGGSGIIGSQPAVAKGVCFIIKVLGGKRAKENGKYKNQKKDSPRRHLGSKDYER